MRKRERSAGISRLPICEPSTSAHSAVDRVRNHVIVGMGGDSLDVPAWLESRDPETGDIQWKWYTTPRPGQPGIETWPDAYQWSTAAG